MWETPNRYASASGTTPKPSSGCEARLSPIRLPRRQRDLIRCVRLSMPFRSLQSATYARNRREHWKRSSRWIAGVALSLAVALCCACEEQRVWPEAALARVDDEFITSGDLDEALRQQRLHGNLRDRLGTLTEEGRREVVQQLVDEHLFAKAARERRLHEAPDVQSAMEAASRRVLVDAYLRRRMEAVDTSEAALRDYYESHPEQFSKPERVLARHLVVKSGEKAERLRQKLVDGADFHELAAEHNVDGSGRRGGELGWVEPGRMVPAFEEVLFDLDPGEIGPVVSTRFGFHVPQVKKRQEAYWHPFDAVRDRVERAVRKEARNALRERLRERYTVQYAEDLPARLRDEESPASRESEEVEIH